MKKRILSIILTLALCLGLLPAVSLTAAATEPDAGKAIQLVTTDNTTGGIKGADKTTDPKNYTYHTLYYGTRSGNPIEWMVLDTKTNTGANGLFLLTKSTYNKIKFQNSYYKDDTGSGSSRYCRSMYDDTDINTWQGSDAQKWCGTFAESAFSTLEAAELLATTKTDKAYTSAQTSSLAFERSNNILNGDKVFFLSGKEADTYFPTGADGNDDRGSNWWLRSPATLNGNTGYIRETGAIWVYYAYKSIPTRPAMNLSLKSILFTSAASGGKSASGMDSGLTAVPDLTQNTWKLTLKDSSRTDFTAGISGISGSTLTISYSGATTGTNEFVSAVILDGSNNVESYGRLCSVDTSGSGTATVTLPDTFNAATDKLYLFSEQYNGDKKTDYAGNMVALDIVGVTAELTGLSSNGSAYTCKGVDYTASLTADAGNANTVYAICDNVEVYVGGTKLDSGSYTFTPAQDGKSGELKINAASITGNITIKAVAKTHAVEVTYSDVSNGVDFGTETYGYSSVDARTITIKNAGNQNLTVSLPDTSSDYFDISITGQDGVLAPSGSIVISAKPKDGLNAKDDAYTKTLDIGITGDNSVNFPQSIEASFTVNKAAWTNTTASGEAKYGKSGTVDLSAQLADGYELGDIEKTTNGDYLDANATLEVDSSGILHFAFAHVEANANKTAEVTIPVTSSTNYNAYDITVTLTVLDKLSQTVSFTESSVTKTYGDAVFTVAADHTVGDGTITYSSSNADVAEVNETTGVVTIKNAGDPVTITATASETDDYKGATASYELTVNKKALTVQPKAVTVYVNSTAPTFELAYTGLVGSDAVTPSTEAQFTLYKSDGTTEITVENAVKTSDTYIIKWDNAANTTFTGADNYEITKTEEATLKVNTRPSGGASIYAVTVENAENGTVKPNRNYASGGSIMTITATPEDGYVLSKLAVTDRQGNKIEVTKKSDGTYTFKMPGRKVTVTAVFVQNGSYSVCPQDKTCPIAKLTDADLSAWYHDGVHYCIDNGLMSGYGDNIFKPDTDTTRAMIVTMLWRMENEPICGGGKSGTFVDVPEYAWYTEAVEWAASEEIVLGYSGNFLPDDVITREQMVTILWRYAKYKGIDVSVGENTNILSFDDALDVSEYAIPAMQWAYGSDMIVGKDNADGTGMILDPNGSGTRAQIATMMMRFCENIVK